MNSDYIKACVAAYLRYERQMAIVVFERCLPELGVPDVLAVTPDRKLLEVEVKISMADFKNDAKKRKFQPYWKDRRKVRKQQYYCMPAKLASVVTAPEGWGLLSVDDGQCYGLRRISVVTKAPVNKLAPRLTIKELVQMVKHQTGTLCHMAAKLARQELKQELIDQYEAVKPEVFT